MSWVSERIRNKISQKVSILLINPPTRNLEYPPLSLAVLSAAMKSRGLTCAVVDANAVMKRWLLSDGQLSRVANEDSASLASMYLGVPEAMRSAASIGSGLRMAAAQAGGYKSIADATTKMRELSPNGVFVRPDAIAVVSAVMKSLRCLHIYLDLCARASLLRLSEWPETLAAQLYLEIAECIASLQPKVIGITAMSPQRLGALWLARLVKSLTDAKVIVGGSDPSKFPEGYLAPDSDVDTVLIGDNLNAIMPYFELVSSQQGPRVVGKMEPITPKLETNKAACNFPPAADYSCFDLQLYLYPVLPIQTSRGCSWRRCDFCDHWQHSPEYVSFNAEMLADQIVQARNLTGIRCFHFADDELEFAHGTELFRRLAQKHANIRVLTYARFDHRMNKDIMRIWHDGGLRVVEWGLESASQPLLNKMHKGIKASHAVRILREAASIGIINKLMMFHNHPEERFGDLDESINLLKELLKDKIIRPFFPIRTRFELRFGTALYRRAESGLFFRKVWWPDGSFSERAEYREAVQDYQRKARAIEGFLRYAEQVMVERSVIGTDDENMCMDLVIRQIQDEEMRTEVSSM